MLDERWIGWAAGLFEGEGCFSLAGKNTPIATLVSTDYDVLVRFWSIVQFGRIHNVHVREGYKPSWRWYCGASDVKKLVGMIGPYLCERRMARAKEVLAIWQKRQDELNDLECEECGINLTILSGRHANRRYCSIACRTEARKTRLLDTNIPC